MIKSYLPGEQTNWDINLGYLAGAYRSSSNESTGLTRNLMMLGREVTLPFEIIKQRKGITEGEEPEKEKLERTSSGSSTLMNLLINITSNHFLVD
jgi:hypothetical protein